MIGEIITMYFPEDIIKMETTTHKILLKCKCTIKIYPRDIIKLASHDFINPRSMASVKFVSVSVTCNIYTWFIH